MGNICPAKADAPYYYYQQLGIREGLSHSKVQCILNDYKGYLWIGTEYGLNRYDGNQVKHYPLHEREGNRLPNNNILFLEEDSLFNLWVGTPLGVYRYDRAKDEFTLPLINDRPIFSTSSLPVEGGVLFSEPGIIYRYTYNTGEFTILYRTTNNTSEFTTFWEMMHYTDDTILLNSRWHGIYSFNLTNLELRKIDCFTGENYTAIYLDSHHRLWVSLYGDGLYCYEGERLIKHFTTANSPLSYDVIHDLVERDNQLWAATDGGGITILSLDDFSFSFMFHNQDATLSNPLKTVYRLYLDPSNNLWAGTIRNGLIGIKNVYARSFQEVPFGYHFGLSNPVVNCLFQDIEGFIWIGTDGGGINRFDPETETFEHYPTTREEKVVSIIEYTPGLLLFSSFNKGIFLFDKQTGAITPFILMDQAMNDRICKSGYSVFLQRVSSEEILFSASQILIYNTRTNTYTSVASMGKEYERNSPTIIATVDNTTYLADRHDILAYDSSTSDFTTIYQGEEVINSACLDQEAVFWIASKNGLQRFNTRTGKTSGMETPVFNEAISVIPDSKQRIWVGTRRNLYIYSADNQNFIDLDEVDGVHPNEYISKATLLSANGDLFFGGTTGLTIVNSQITFNTSTKHAIELLEVLLNGSPASVQGKKGEVSNTVRIPWHFTSLQLNVLLKEDDIFRENRFSFHVKGKGMELFKTSNNQLIINYFPVGNYTITASYLTRSGTWSAEQDLLQVIVTPPWWETARFRILLVLFTGLIISGIIYYFHQKNRAKQKQEIARLKNSLNEDKVTFLTNISHELRTPLTLIYAPLKRIIERKTDWDSIDDQLYMIFNQSRQMMSILDTVLDVRKLEEGKELLDIRGYELNEWVHSVGNKFAGEYEAKGIKLKYNFDDEIKSVPFDKMKCEFVLSNFLINAFKFSESGTAITLSTRLSENREWARVSVQDEGIGLEAVDPKSVFSNFYQGTHHKGGSGIGLSYSKSLITLHKGKIGALNAPERGSIFYFELPLKAEKEAAIASKEINEVITFEGNNQEEVDYRYLENFSVTVVEDTAELRVYLKETLSRYFNRVYTAENGAEGLKQIKEKLPDIIISDVMMPRMNGFELCSQVKSDLDISHIPFILLTAYSDPRNMHTGYKTGADAFLSKPFDVDTLLALVYNQMKQRALIRARYQENSLVSPKEISFSNADEAFLLKFNSLIEENMSNPKLDVPFLASNMFMSRSLLFNKVKAITGMGIIDYINKQRVEKSVVLLTTTRLTISEISDMVGFSSPRYFSRVFKSNKGVVPSEYRKE